jgi:hypothetical protein
VPEIVSADTRALTQLGVRLRLAQKTVYAALQREVRGIGEETIAPRARANAGWSKKIPPTITASAKGLRTVVRAGNADVPIARWFENGRTASRGVWRHPVFPSEKVPRSRWNWVDMKDPHRPFLGPALEESRSEATDRLTEATMNALRALEES